MIVSQEVETMNSNDNKFIEELTAQYKIVCVEDLSEISSKHSKIFRIFQKHHKEAFTDNERFIFYSKHDPSQDLLNHVQKAANIIDISNWFILFVTPFCLLEKLKKANQKFGNSKSPMNYLQVNDIQSKKLFQLPIVNYSTLCPYPFVKIEAFTGKSYPCCKFKESVGDPDKEAVSDIFNSEKIIKIREQMITGQKPTECSVCWDAESKGVTSFRQLGLQKYKHKIDMYIDSPELKDLTYALSSLCNFKCRICDYVNSSSIAVEKLKFETSSELKHKIRNHIKLTTTNVNQRSANIIFGDHLKNLEFLHLLGGETFLLPEMEETITKLIDSGHSKHIGIDFNTNGSIFPASYIFKIIENFASVEILLSIDDIGPRFEVQRGGNWQDVKTNIIKFSNLKSKKVKVKLAPTVNIQNLLYLDELVEFAESINLNFVWWYLEEPKELCIDNLTSAAQKIVHNKYHNHRVEELRKIANRVRKNNPVSGKPFVEFMHQIDCRRNEKFSNTHQEIFTAMNLN